MDILPSGNIFRELQDIHDTGYFSSQVSIEDQWQQASVIFICSKMFEICVNEVCFITRYVECLNDCGRPSVNEM